MSSRVTTPCVAPHSSTTSASLQALVAQQVQQPLQLQRRRDGEHRDGELARGAPSPVGLRDGDGVLDVHDPGDLVEVGAVHREAGVARLGGGGDDVGRGGAGPQRPQLGARGHDVGGELARRSRSERCSSRAATGERSPSSADRRATAASSSASRAVSSSSRGSKPSRRTIQLASPCSAPTSQAGDPGEGPHARGDEGGDRQRVGDGQVLRAELAEQHLQGGRQRDGQPDRDRGGGGLRQAERLQRPAQQPAERRLGEVADDQRGERDAELGGRQLGGQRPQRARRRRGARRSPARRRPPRPRPRSTVVRENSAATKNPVKRGQHARRRAGAAIRSSGGPVPGNGDAQPEERLRGRHRRPLSWWSG